MPVGISAGRLSNGRVGCRFARCVALALGLAGGAWLLAPGGAAGQPTEAQSVVAVVGTLDAPFATVREVLLDLEGFSRWFPPLGAWRVLARDEEGARVHGVQALPWPVRDRDYVVRYRGWEDWEGAFFLEATGLPGAAPPPAEGVVRLEDLRSEWRLRATPAGTEARDRYAGSPGGALPEWVSRIGWQSRTRAVVDGLRREVERRLGR